MSRCDSGCRRLRRCWRDGGCRSLTGSWCDCWCVGRWHLRCRRARRGGGRGRVRRRCRKAVRSSGLFYAAIGVLNSAYRNVREERSNRSEVGLDSDFNRLSFQNAGPIFTRCGPTRSNSRAPRAQIVTYNFRGLTTGLKTDGFARSKQSGVTCYRQSCKGRQPGSILATRVQAWNIMIKFSKTCATGNICWAGYQMGEVRSAIKNCGN